MKNTDRHDATRRKARPEASEAIIIKFAMCAPELSFLKSPIIRNDYQGQVNDLSGRLDTQYIQRELGLYRMGGPNLKRGVEVALNL